MVKTYRPADLNEALRILGSGPVVVMAGGTDLMVRHKTWSGVVPGFDRQVMFVGHLPEIQAIEITDDGLVIGSAVTLADILDHPAVPEYIKKPITEMASPPIRNLATLGGNICNASPAGDSLPMLYALGARLQLQSTQEIQTVPITEFIVGPGRTTRQPEQLLTRIEIPLPRSPACYYRKVGQRKANSISKVSFYAIADHDQNRINWVRIALGAVGPVVVRSQAAEAVVAGRNCDELKALIPEVKEMYGEMIKPVDDIRSTRSYRQEVSLRLLENYLARELMK